MHFNSIQKAQKMFGGGDSFSRGQDELRMLTEGFRIRHKRIINNRLRYDVKGFEEQNESFCRDEAKGILKGISNNYPNFQLHNVKGYNLEEIETFKRKVSTVDIYRIKDEHGYCLDFEIVEIKDFKNEYKVAHVKFIHQCAEIFFNNAFFYLMATVIGNNQYKVRVTRHGKNWRTQFAALKNYQNKNYETFPRLLGFYLRTGWILNGECRNNGTTIMLQSPLSKKMLWEKDPEEFKNKYAYFKDYENEIKKRTRNQKI